jgi:hypothetical protein
MEKCWERNFPRSLTSPDDFPPKAESDGPRESVATRTQPKPGAHTNTAEASESCADEIFFIFNSHFHSGWKSFAVEKLSSSSESTEKKKKF